MSDNLQWLVGEDKGPSWCQGASPRYCRNGVFTGCWEEAWRGQIKHVVLTDSTLSAVVFHLQKPLTLPQPLVRLVGSGRQPNP